MNKVMCGETHRGEKLINVNLAKRTKSTLYSSVEVFCLDQLYCIILSWANIG